MTFTPALPLGGLAGWAFLKRTEPAQKAALDRTAEARRDEAYFREKIGSITSAEELVSDRRLLKVALGAFGLEADIQNRAFIRKVLEDGTLKPEALSNRLADKQYRAMSAAFGFGDFSVPRTKLSDFADKVLPTYADRRFEAAVGAQNNSFRIALNAERELPALAGRNTSDATKWFTILGNAPLRELFSTALRLPSGFGALDLDRQVKLLKERADTAFGSDRVDQFSDPAKVDTLIRRYLIQTDLAGGTATGLKGQVALQLLQTGR
jgi:hypothetical protein